MKHILIGLVLFARYPTTDLIKEIREEYYLINTSIHSYSKVTNNDINVYKDLNPNKYSFESEDIYRLAIINLVRYYDNNQIKKAIVSFNGDREDLISTYYYKNESLFFVFKTKINYTNPKHSENFDENDKEVLEDRFYFNENKLIKWIDSNKETVNLSTIDNNLIKNLLSDAALYKSIVK